MKKARTILYLLLLSHALKAQQTSIVGTVAVFNSKTETGKRQFIQNAQVEETFGKSQATTTDADEKIKQKQADMRRESDFVVSNC